MPVTVHPDTRGRIETAHLTLDWMEVPWDSRVFGFPVLQIQELVVLGRGADLDVAPFEAARDRVGSALVSCRLPCEKLRESMFLEANGFRFVDMIIHPELAELQRRPAEAESGLTAAPADAVDLAAIEAIAVSAFRNERFFVDPRLDPTCAGQRYRNWARSALDHPRQRLYAVRDGEHLVAFFVTELLSDGTAYWHLNAVAPVAQGCGYGRRAWQAMLGEARRQGAERVRSSIAVRNHRVLNLYAQLGFRFSPPLMTFHWVAGDGR